MQSRYSRGPKRRFLIASGRRGSLAGCRARMMDQQIANALHDHLGVFARLRRVIALRQHSERAALPAPDQVAATAVRAADQARHAPDAGIAGSFVEGLVVGGEIIYV